MNFNKETEQIFCHICGKWFPIRQGSYLDGDMVKCLECDALLGYTWDWPELFDPNYNPSIDHIQRLGKEC